VFLFASLPSIADNGHAELRETFMAITFSCPTCSETFEVESVHAGKTTRCAACGEEVRIPGSPPPKPAAEKRPVADTLKASGKRLSVGIVRLLSALIAIIAVAIALIAVWNWNPFGILDPNRAAVKAHRAEFVKEAKSLHRLLKSDPTVVYPEKRRRLSELLSRFPEDGRFLPIRWRAESICKEFDLLVQQAKSFGFWAKREDDNSKNKAVDAAKKVIESVERQQQLLAELDAMRP
jgi:hypothetical protein